MKGFEGAPSMGVGRQPDVELEDFADSPQLTTLLKRLPAELRQVHMQRIADLSDEEATGYLYALHESREEALRESDVSDESLTVYFGEHEKEIFSALETHVFSSTENHVGAGTTARIKSFDLSQFGQDEAPTVAVKYLVSPTQKTLSVSGEHDLLAELEQLKKIEEVEREALGMHSRLRVPHPYFYYRKGKTQCYAMELIDGFNLEQAVDEDMRPDQKEALRSALENLDEEALMEEIDVFFSTMHSICLHGDTKPRNIMVSNTGQFYIIDFGQSVLATSVDERSGPAFDQLKEDEKSNAKNIVKRFLKTIR